MKFGAFMIGLTLIFYPSQLLEVLICVGVFTLFDIQKALNKKETK